MEKICGLTFREKMGDPITPIDIIDEKVTLYIPEGMTLLEVVNKYRVPLATDSEAIAMKIIAATDRLKSRTSKAVQDLDDAMKIFSKLHKEGGGTYYTNEVEKAIIKVAFQGFYPRYKAAKVRSFGPKKNGKIFLEFD